MLLSYVLLSYVLLSYVLLSFVLLIFVLLSFVLLSFVLQSYVLLSYVLLSYVLLSFVLLSFVLLSFVLLSFVWEYKAKLLLECVVIVHRHKNRLINAKYTWRSLVLSGAYFCNYRVYHLQTLQQYCLCWVGGAFS